MTVWCQSCGLQDAEEQFSWVEQTGIFSSTRYISDLCLMCAKSKTELAANGSIWGVKKFDFSSRITHDYNFEEKKWIRRI